MATTPSDVDAATGLPIGPLVLENGPAHVPEQATLTGRWCRLELLDPPVHGDELFSASSPPDAAARFLYLPDDPPPDRQQFDQWLVDAVAARHQQMWVVIDASTGRVEGRQAFLRIDPPNRSIEIGNVYWGPGISQTRVSTEALFLFARHAFDDLGYRRFEWKCNALNAPSRRAAERFGFEFEGTFRRAAIIKGRSRDTAWYSIIDEDWPTRRTELETWLDPTNFDERGTQRHRLGADRRTPSGH